jgi:hypothetical protein
VEDAAGAIVSVDVKPDSGVRLGDGCEQCAQQVRLVRAQGPAGRLATQFCTQRSMIAFVLGVWTR